MLLWPFNKYPGTDYETFNWEWILKTVKEYTAKVDDFIENINDTWNTFKENINDTWNTFRNWVTHEIANMHRDFAIYVNATEGALNTGAIADGAVTYAKLDGSLKTYVTPEMFGAVGDGVADDTEAFQQCIENNRIIICENRYKLSAPIDFTNKENILILGGEFVRGADLTFNTFIANNASNITVKGCMFDGNGNNRNIEYTWKENIQGCILFAEQCKNIHIEDCTIKNYNYGIFIVGAGIEADQNDIENVKYDGTIENCTFVHCHSVIDTYGKSITIKKNFIFDTTEHAIQIEPYYTDPPTMDNMIDDYEHFYSAAVGFTVEDNTIFNCVGIAINIQRGSYCGNVTNNNILNYGEGIRVQPNSLYVNVTNNNLWYQKKQTVDTDKRPYNYAPAINMQTRGNVVSNSINDCVVGICINKAQLGTCSNNIINKPELCGLATFEIDDCVITDNVVRDFVRNISAWYGCLPACLFKSYNTIFDNNILKTDGNSNSMFIDGVSTTIGGNYTTKLQSDDSAWIKPDMYKSGGTSLAYDPQLKSGISGTVKVKRDNNIINITGLSVGGTDEVLNDTALRSPFLPDTEIDFLAISNDGTVIKRGWITTEGIIKISGATDGTRYNFNVAFVVRK